MTHIIKCDQCGKHADSFNTAGFFVIGQVVPQLYAGVGPMDSTSGTHICSITCLVNWALDRMRSEAVAEAQAAVNFANAVQPEEQEPSKRKR
jgi:hypothetical protein